jgi:ferredoxin
MELVYLSDVVTLKLCEEACNGCGMCLKVCPHNVFELSGKKAQIINIDHCMECGACAMNCPEGAVTVKSGVGCASGILNGILNNTEPTCSCSGSDCC